MAVSCVDEEALGSRFSVNDGAAKTVEASAKEAATVEKVFIVRLCRCRERKSNVPSVC